MHIGILQTGHAPDEIRARDGDYSDIFAAMLASQGLTSTNWAVVDGEFPDNPDAADGWIITGSRHGVYEDHDWIAPLEAFVRAAHVAEAPMVGICFGHQIIAQALGGQVEKAPGGWIVGRQGYDFDGRTVWMNAWHQDQVLQPPANARTLAAGAGCPHAALAIGNHILTYQAHPEYTAELLEILVRTRGPGVVPERLRTEALAHLDQPTDSGQVIETIADFLKEAHRG